MVDEFFVPNYNKERVRTRSVDELLGLCRGIICDGQVCEQEVKFLSSWLEGNRHLLTVWPTNVLAAKLDSILADGKVEPKELVDLAQLIKTIVTEDVHVGDHFAALSAQLPLDPQQPRIIFEDRTFCFTGKFIFGTRDECERQVEMRGGIAKGGVSSDLDYLVIGLVANPQWAHKTYGRKIESAVDLRSSGKSLSIISEEHWSKFL